MKMFKSLKLKILFYFFVSNIIILSGFSIFIYNTAQKGVMDTLDTMLKIISIDAVPDLKDKVFVDAKDISSELIEEFGIMPLYVKIIYYDKSTNGIIRETLSSEDKVEIFDISLNPNDKLYNINYFDKGLYRVSSIVLSETEKMKIFFQLSTTKIIDSPYLDKILTSLLIANPIILILLLFIVNILINTTLQPVKKVVQDVHSISSNNLANRINTQKIPTEIEELVKTFNQLLENLEESFHRISSFSSDASHELKTPLTVMRGEIEVALRQERTSEEYKDILEDVLSETVRVQEIIEQLFLLTKKDTEELKANYKEVYLDEILTDSVSLIEKFAMKKSVSVKITKIIPITIFANETLLKICIDNLLRNAISYSKEAGEVYVSVNENSIQYLLEIKDNGSGIAQKDLPFIFDRFYRADKARSRQKGGTGLGLAIVKMILDLHNYDIAVESVLNEGTKVIIKIQK
ncbi:HAMP domain-containing protein [Sulfurimonas lithotrophica]|uniref:histidine kinase n=2 Tax=Sulfurimonas lithotrophica TaxID=2590022 RepID=A0A5P8P2M8_9BACT|nr:HAMP domain-containing protein [Sulfurimonas lithotrophica]